MIIRSRQLRITGNYIRCIVIIDILTNPLGNKIVSQWNTMRFHFTLFPKSVKLPTCVGVSPEL